MLVARYKRRRITSPATCYQHPATTHSQGGFLAENAESAEEESVELTASSYEKRTWCYTFLFRGNTLARKMLKPQKGNHLSTATIYPHLDSRLSFLDNLSRLTVYE
jgi:hypothetical protein